MSTEKTDKHICTNTSTASSRRRLLVIIIIILSGFSSACKGSVVIKPNSTIALVGDDILFSCTSDLLSQPIWWYSSEARQSGNKLVSNEVSVKDEFKSRFNVTSYLNDNEKTSEMTIRNVEMRDAGTIYCKDDGDFGKYISAKLSVATEIRCSAACVDNHLLVTCSTCYWSEDHLQLVLNYTEEIKPNASSEAYMEENMCIRYKAVWEIKASCHNENRTDLVATLKEESTGASLSPPALKVLSPGADPPFHKSFENFIICVQQIPSNAWKVAALVLIAIVCVMMTVVSLSTLLYRSRRMNNKLKKAKVNETEQESQLFNKIEAEQSTHLRLSRELNDYSKES